ncbi:MAG: hypothetical protein HC817_15025 [Saprospiraceae bacterium]|nr:hypothetical protein [Saprospiraceae bacterium]
MEIMVDACGDAEEFNREYVLLRAGEIPLLITDFSLRVTNPFNNSNIGSVIIERDYANPRAIAKLNSAVSNAVCPYGISFRDVMAPPYNGVVPPNTPVLVFNNKDSIDLNFLDANTLSALCGSKVLVAIGTVRPQSPGTPIFRNYPRNRSCGTTGCLRTISFQFEKSAPFCQQITYDILKLPHPAVIRPNEEFGDGSFIRFGRNNNVEYLGGGPNGASTVCLPDENMRCVIPAQPSFGQGFWQVLTFDGYKNFSNFKGFYQANGNHPTAETNTEGSFEYNTARDGWSENDAPSEAHPTYGARKPYDGCNVRADSFTIVARKQGFACGDYALRLINYDDFLRVRVDTEGDGIWDFDQTFESENCAECNTELWQGRLATNSRVEIQSADLRKKHNVHLVFEKKPSAFSSIKIAATTTNTSNCRIADGTLNASITGGVAPYQIKWNGPTTIPNEATNAINLNAGIYLVTVTDGQQCRDSARILVAQTSDLIVNAGRDTAFCAGGNAILRGSASGGTGTLTFSWENLEGQFLTNQPQISLSPAQTTAYVFTAFDTKGCSKTDTVLVTVNSPPLLKVTISTSDTICNDANPRLTVTGAQTYQWSSNPPIGKSAVRGGDLTASSILIDAIFLPAPVYIFSVEGTDANGCKNSVAAPPIVINPLPVVVFTPVRDTLCSNGTPQPLRVSIPNGVFTPQFTVRVSPV